AQGAEAGLVAQADAGAETKVGNGGENVGRDIATVNEADDADILSDAGAGLHGAFEQIAAAGDVATAVIDADGAVAIAADGPAAAGKEQLVGRDLVQGRTDHGTGAQAAGEHELVVFAKTEIGTALDNEPGLRVAVDELVVGLERALEVPAFGGVGGVVAEVQRGAAIETEHGEVVGAEDVVEAVALELGTGLEGDVVAEHVVQAGAGAHRGFGVGGIDAALG